eukprot:TRINITY_DN10610_c0_g1_i1.p1 TRINITY_DN10610_c0_g1~~TRINITY_DN10610_c0_g1_i1.p1  ORF type:complete len:223 (+),score=50.07 TRINITY_DN10610_c0_g1_i1:42-671(+)
MFRRRQLENAALPDDISGDRFSEDVGMARMVSSVFNELMGGRFDLYILDDFEDQNQEVCGRKVVVPIVGLLFNTKRRKASKMQVHLIYHGIDKIIDGLTFYRLFTILKSNYTSTLKIQRQASIDSLGKEECPICMATHIEQVLPCAHGFCNQCILSWSKGVCYTCPICRASISSEEIDYTFALLEPSLEDFVESLTGSVDKLLLGEGLE